MAKNTRYKRMVGEREKRIKDLKGQLRGHEQLQELYAAYIACLLERLGAHDTDSSVKLARQEIGDRLEDTEVIAGLTETGEILLYARKKGKHGEDNGDSCWQG